MELMPAVQVKGVKLLHVFGTDHTLVLSIHQRLGRSLLRGRGHSDWPPDRHLHLHVHCLLQRLLLLGQREDRQLSQLGFCRGLKVGGDWSLWEESMLGRKPLNQWGSGCGKRSWQPNLRRWKGDGFLYQGRLVEGVWHWSGLGLGRSWRLHNLGHSSQLWLGNSKRCKRNGIIA